MAASGLILLAGLLLFVDGVAILAAGTPTGPYAYYALPSVSALVGGMGAFFGFVLILFGIYLLLEPLNHRAFGIVVIGVSLITVGFSFEFLIEAILAVFGGILAILFSPGVEVRSIPRAGDEGHSSA